MQRSFSYDNRICKKKIFGGVGAIESANQKHRQLLIEKIQIFKEIE